MGNGFIKKYGEETQEKAEMTTAGHWIMPEANYTRI
jgi:hypothetical protein